MINKYLKPSILIVCSLFALSCGGGGDDDPVVPKVDNPEASILISPLKNEACNQGNSVSTTESKVNFEWNAAKFTNRYTLVVKNLNTNTTQEVSVSATTASLNLLKGVPYSWNVISKNAGTSGSATSETWNFYNAGNAVSNYAPFPAEATAPSNGSLTSFVTSLKWKGSDVDNDIDNYDVYLGTQNPPTEKYSTTTNTSIDNITLVKDKVYYWYIITKDKHGNTSKSPVFDFRTQ